MEAELKELSPEEAAEYLADLGAEEGGLSSLIAATYMQLGLRTYFTVGPKARLVPGSQPQSIDPLRVVHPRRCTQCAPGFRGLPVPYTGRPGAASALFRVPGVDWSTRRSRLFGASRP